MALSYFDDLEDFGLPDCDGYDSSEEARDAIIEAFADFNMEVEAESMSEEDLEELDGYVLFAWLFDYDLSLSLFAIPKEDLSKPLAKALAKADGRAYAHHELSLADAAAEAYVRIEAAMGQDVGVFLEKAKFKIAESDYDCLADYRIGYVSDGDDFDLVDGGLDKRFVAAYSANRAQ